MAITYVNIASQVLGSNTSPVTFSSIPSTYTDLVLKMSVRMNFNNLVTRLRWNNDSSSVYSLTDLIGQGGSILNDRYSNNTEIDTSRTTQASANYFADTFTPIEVYMPNYRVSDNKPFSIVSHAMNSVNSPTNIEGIAALWRNTASISSITIYPNAGGSFVAGSSFYLYGIKRD